MKKNILILIFSLFVFNKEFANFEKQLSKDNNKTSVRTHEQLINYLNKFQWFDDKRHNGFTISGKIDIIDENNNTQTARSNTSIEFVCYKDIKNNNNAEFCKYEQIIHGYNQFIILRDFQFKNGNFKRNNDNSPLKIIFTENADQITKIEFKKI